MCGSYVRSMSAFHVSITDPKCAGIRKILTPDQVRQIHKRVDLNPTVVLKLGKTHVASLLAQLAEAALLDVNSPPNQSVWKNNTMNPLRLRSIPRTLTRNRNRSERARIHLAPPSFILIQPADLPKLNDRVLVKLLEHLTNQSVQFHPLQHSARGITCRVILIFSNSGSPNTHFIWCAVLKFLY